MYKIENNIDSVHKCKLVIKAENKEVFSQKYNYYNACELSYIF